MRRNTESGNVVSSHSAACGASSRVTKAWIDSRRRSCSSVKMKCRREAAKSGLRTSAAGVPMKVDSRTAHFRWQPRPDAERLAPQHPEVLEDALHERVAVSRVRDPLEPEARVDGVLGADDAALVQLIGRALPAVLLLGRARRRRAD